MDGSLPHGRHRRRELRGACRRRLARPFVGPPAPKLRRVSKPAALHVVVRDFDDELRTKRFPREILALAPAAHRARSTMWLAFARISVRPCTPRVTLERILAIRREELDELSAL